MCEGRPPEGRLAGTVFEGYPQRENFLAAAWWRAEDCPRRRCSPPRAAHLGPHRLARVGSSAGVTWWNDSKATNFHAVAAALDGFAAPVILIAGGKPKGGDIAAFVRRIAPRVRYACLIGETRFALAEACAASGVAYSICQELAEAVRQAAALARPGDHVLLSPAFASFDQFEGYADRGTRFIALVRALSAPAPVPAPHPLPCCIPFCPESRPCFQPVIPMKILKVLGVVVAIHATVFLCRLRACRSTGSMRRSAARRRGRCFADRPGRPRPRRLRPERSGRPALQPHPAGHARSRRDPPAAPPGSPDCHRSRSGRGGRPDGNLRRPEERRAL